MKSLKDKIRTPTKVTSSILKGLNQALAHSKGDISFVANAKTVSISPLPNYGKKEIKNIRSKLHLSQNLFAKAVGVSKKTVEAWESGRNIPQGSAQRILFIFNSKPIVLNELKIIS